MKYAVCIVLPSNKCDTMETNFQNTKNWPFSNLIIFLQQSCVWKTYIVSKYPMSGLQIPWIKKLKMFIIFVSMATELTNWQSEILQNTPNSKQIILLMQTEIWVIYTHSGKSTSY